MNNIINYINIEFKDCNDLIQKEIKIGFKKYYILFLETLCSSDKVNTYVLNGFSFNKNIKNIKKNIPSPNFINIKTKEKIGFYLFNGYTIIIYKDEIYGVETKANLDRSISESTVEKDLYGPKDSLVENIQINLGLIKRRLKTSHLKNDIITIGKETKTITNLLYIDNICDTKLVNNIKNKLNDIKIDSILDSNNIRNILDKSNNPFPTIKISERPDTISAALLNGKVVILVDGSPSALIMPSFLLDFFNPASDNYSKTINVIFLKLLRVITFFCSIIIPSIYISIITFNQETIPLSLLLNFQSQQSNIPFPPIVEALIMIIVCEILKESDLRFPNSYGSAISILGALILGEAAVHAGLVSPIMIIVIAITYISSLLFNDNEITGAIRLWRLIFLLFSTILGLYGIALSIILFIINITSYKSMYLNYTFPIEPMNKNYLKKIILGIKTKRVKQNNNGEI